MPTIYNPIASYRQTFVSGLAAGIGAGTSTLGHILAMRMPTSAPLVARVRSLEVEFVLTTAFGAAQEVGYDAFVARTYTAAHGAGTALTIATNDGKLRSGYPTATLTGRICNASALTAGTHTFDSNPIARGSVWCGAVGARIEPMLIDFTGSESGGQLLAADEGIVVRNSVLMGASGVGKWFFSLNWDEGLLV